MPLSPTPSKSSCRRLCVDSITFCIQQFPWSESFWCNCFDGFVSTRKMCDSSDEGFNQILSRSCCSFPLEFHVLLEEQKSVMLQPASIISVCMNRKAATLLHLFLPSKIVHSIFLTPFYTYLSLSQHPELHESWRTKDRNESVHQSNNIHMKLNISNTFDI